jgi:D-3-phosphoglycerate dehydrogenase / 2-oxoglutarate reductase
MSNFTSKAVITDWTFGDLSVEKAILEPLNISVLGRQCKTEAELSALVSDADCVIAQFAKINSTVIGNMNKARAIVRYGIGVDNVDLTAARERGIAVCNVPDYCIDEVADHTLAFILSLTRQVATHNTQLHNGVWALAVPLSQMRALRDCAVAVIGFGRIGREVVQRLRPFKCKILVYDPIAPAADISAAGALPVSLAEALGGADIVTLHCPSNAQTRKMMNRETFQQMKCGSLFINVARGDLVDTDALVNALRDEHLAAAALDVCDPEPIPSGHPLMGLGNVILAPHIASASSPAVIKLRETVARTAAAAVQRRPLPNVVNGVKS